VTDVGIVVPAYRPDPAQLRSYVEELASTVDATVRVELDDPDPSVLTALEDCPATVHSASRRRGKGAAITAGFEALDADVLAFADADGSTPAASIAEVVRTVRDGDADLAVGSRRHPDADVRSHQTFARRRLGDGFAWIARRLLETDLSDYQCGAKAITHAAWEEVKGYVYEPGFAWDIELIAMTDALGYEVREVPITWIDSPESTVSPVETSVRLGWALVRVGHRARRARGNRIHGAIPGNEGSALTERTTGSHRVDDD